MSTNQVAIVADRQEPFTKLPALAKRLGVEPNQSASPTVTLMMRDGRAYDLFDLVNAFLDRIDEALNHGERSHL